MLDALNTGMLMMGRKPETEVEKTVMEFVPRNGLLGIQMMFSFMLVDNDQPLRLCKHCQKVFWAAGPAPPFAAHAAKISTMSTSAGGK